MLKKRRLNRKLWQDYMHDPAGFWERYGENQPSTLLKDLCRSRADLERERRLLAAPKMTGLELLEAEQEVDSLQEFNKLTGEIDRGPSATQRVWWAVVDTASVPLASRGFVAALCGLSTIYTFAWVLFSGRLLAAAVLFGFMLLITVDIVRINSKTLRGFVLALFIIIASAFKSVTITTQGGSPAGASFFAVVVKGDQIVNAVNFPLTQSGGHRPQPIPGAYPFVHHFEWVSHFEPFKHHGRVYQGIANVSGLPARRVHDVQVTYRVVFEPIVLPVSLSSLSGFSPQHELDLLVGNIEAAVAQVDYAGEPGPMLQTLYRAAVASQLSALYGTRDVSVEATEVATEIFLAGKWQRVDMSGFPL